MARITRRIIGLIILAVFIIPVSGAMADTLVIPPAVTVIGEEAFRGDRSLDEVLLPAGLLSIESMAFAESGIRSVNLPASLEFIADDAFDHTDIQSVIASEDSYAYKWACIYGLIGESDFPTVDPGDEYDNWDPSVEEDPDEDPEANRAVTISGRLVPGGTVADLRK